MATEEWASSEQSTARRPAPASRAAASAESVEVEAVSSMCPNQFSGKPSNCLIQPSVTCSSSVAAGELRQSIAFTFRAAISISARIPGSEAVVGK